MLTNTLPVFIAILIFFLGILWTVREMYVHEFRTTDMNFYSHILESEITKDNKVRDFHIRMAKQWLKMSEDYRRACIDFSCMAAYMFWGVLTTTLGSLTYILVGTKFTITAFIANPLHFLFTILFLVFGLILIVCSVLVLLIRYAKRKIGWLCGLLQKEGCWLAERIPVLKISHLKHWEEIKEIVDAQKWIGIYIKSLPCFNDLKKYFGYLGIAYP